MNKKLMPLSDHCEICGKTKFNKRFCSFKCYWKSLKGNQLHFKPELHTDKKVLCACGCGQSIPILDRKYRKRKFINGHAQIGRERPDMVIILANNRLNHKGKKHWNWKGGISDENSKIRRSYKYNIWRKAVYKRDNWTCQICGIKQKHPIAHHKKSFNDYPELRFKVRNGITVCRSCHKIIHKNIGLKTRFKN